MKSYNASDLKLDLVKDLVVPNSDARTLGHHAITIQIDKEKNIYVNSKEVGLAVGAGTNSGLLAKLKELKEQEKLRIPAANTTKKDVKNINLVFDESLPYEVMKSIMHTSAIAGYTEFKFIVQGNY